MSIYQGFFFWIHVFGIIKSEKEMNSVSCYFMWLYFKDCFQILLHIPLIDTSKKYSHFISYLIKHAKSLKSVRRQDSVVVLVLQIFLITEKAINTYLLQASGEWMDIHKDLLKTYIHKNPGNICAAQLDLSMPPLDSPILETACFNNAEQITCLITCKMCIILPLYQARESHDVPVWTTWFQLYSQTI